MKSVWAAILSSLLFGLTLYIAVPNFIGGSASLENIETLASPDEREAIARGKVSAALSAQLPHDKVITESDLAAIDRSGRAHAIFPPDLTFPELPQRPSDEEKQIARDQRIALLENQVRALQAELEIVNSAKTSWSWDVVDTLWAIIVWAVGVISSTVLKYHTESLLKKRAE